MEKWIMEGVAGGYEIRVKDNTWPSGSRPIARTKNTGKDAAEFEATARLMVAAPALLEACEDILKRFGGHVRDYEEMTAGQKLAIERTVEAIRKAEGKN